MERPVAQFSLSGRLIIPLTFTLHLFLGGCRGIRKADWTLRRSGRAQTGGERAEALSHILRRTSAVPPPLPAQEDQSARGRSCAVSYSKLICWLISARRL